VATTIEKLIITLEEFNKRKVLTAYDKRLLDRLELDTKQVGRILDELTLSFSAIIKEKDGKKTTQTEQINKASALWFAKAKLTKNVKNRIDFFMINSLFFQSITNKYELRVNLLQPLGKSFLKTYLFCFIKL